ncbi:uncharacterized protein QC761_123358 [Podospora bellae-mahoneyi]|uniref:Uncharacterized protein n=1 Tax=Podospora bellae-mahoneyi TaxID=2093777 RepID=A0ABR0FVR3_9PEZI|nr:hypothetical protein QC761_123358 [Podospora bellae-mahoneyi]
MPYNLRQKSKPVVNMSPIEVEDNTMTLLEELKTVMDTTTRLYILTPSLSVGILETALSTLHPALRLPFQKVLMGSKMSSYAPSSPICSLQPLARPERTYMMRNIARR